MNLKNTIICLMGATATGKTALAAELVQRFPCEIISVDSAMVYRGMDIGTAKPSSDILEKAPHRLIDICDPAEAYSAGRFRCDALEAITEILAAGKIPLLVGGTMLYFHILQQGVAALPSADKAVRDALTEEADKRGWAALHQDLAAVDPKAAEHIHPNDAQRIQRALEVYRISGQTISALQALQEEEVLPYRVINLSLLPEDRAVLHKRIEQRFHTMISEGFVEEVETLRARGDLHAQLPSIRSVGYRQVWKHLEGEYDYPTMIDRGIIATRQLAKRQLTWLRRWKNTKDFCIEDARQYEQVFAYLKEI